MPKSLLVRSALVLAFTISTFSTPASKAVSSPTQNPGGGGGACGNVPCVVAIH